MEERKRENRGRENETTLRKDLLYQKEEKIVMIF